MKKIVALTGSVSLLMVGILAALAWGLQSAYSAQAQDITDINPVAYAGPDQAAGLGDTVALDGRGSYDPDNDLPLSYLWAQTGGPAVAFNPILSVTVFIAPSTPAVLTFTLAITDSLGFTDPTPDEVVIRALGQPVAVDDSGVGFTTDEDTPFITADVLANDTDPSGSPLWVHDYDTSGTLGQLSLADPAGGLDTTGFNTPDGFVTVNFGGSSNSCYGIATQSDGKSIVAGDTYMSGHFLFAMARYNPNGSLDTTFGSGGIVTTIFNDSSVSWAIAVQPDGKILLAGETSLDYDKNFALARYNPGGSLDNTFGSGGKATADFGSEYDEARDIAIQPDGKIILAGSTDQEDFAIARFNPDGSLDVTFDSDGMVVTDFGGYDDISGVVIQSDGKIVATGTRWGIVNADFALARYNSDGSLDTTFGIGGMVTTDFGSNEQGWPVIIQPNSKIIMAGSAYNGSNYDFALARYNQDGSLDLAFDADGKVVTDFGGTEWGRDVLRQLDGKLIVAGETNDGADADFALARYNPDGSLDTSFGQNGKSTVDFDDEDDGYAVALQEEGNILMAGRNHLARFMGQDAGLFAYDPTGPFDYLPAGEVATDTFTYVVTNGILTDTATVSITVIGVNYPPVANAGIDQNAGVGSTATLDGRGSFDIDGDLPMSFLWTQAGGPAVAFNSALSITTFTAPATPAVLTFTLTVTDHAGLADATPDVIGIQVFGQPAASDDSGEGYITDANTAFLTADVLANDYDPGGSPLSLQSFDTSETLGLVTYGLRPGDLDAAGFGAPDGYVILDFGSNWDSGHDLALQPDGKIVLAGRRNTTDSFTVARANPDGSLDATFGAGGVVMMDFDGSGGEFNAVAIQSDGKIVAAGHVGYYDFAVARLNPDGSLDDTFGTEGKVTTSFGDGVEDIAYAMKVQTDGKIVLAGTTTDSDSGNPSIAVARFNPDGSLDATFGTDGKVITNFYESANSHDLVILPDGKLIVAGTGRNEPGTSSDFLVVRYNPDGSLDDTFGDGGKVFTDFGDSDYGSAVTVYDNQIIVAGIVFDYEGNSFYAMARYNPDGSLDATFGDGGKVATEGGYHDDIALQSDSKILLLGSNFVLLRFNPNGSLDPTFGENGIATPDFGDYSEPYSLVIQPDGMIVATGSQGYGGDAILARFLDQGDGTFHYDPDGQFGSLAPGEAATDTFTYIATNSALTDTATVSITITGVDNAPIAVDDRGPAFTTDEDTAFVTGDVLANDTHPEGAPLFVESFDTSGMLGMLTPFEGSAGMLDTEGFGAPNGYAITNFGPGDFSMVVLIHPDGKILQIGVVYSDDGSDFALVRYNPNGNPDGTFGNTDGKVLTDFGGDEGSFAGALQVDDKVIAAGATTTGGETDFALARYNPDGSLDDSFGGDGKVTTDLGGLDEIFGVAVQLDGKILAAGHTDTYGTDDLALVRYNPDGSLDATFGTDGKVITDFGNEDGGSEIIIQPEGKILVQGSTSIDGDGNFALARYHADGSLDDTFGIGGKVTTDFGFDESGTDIAVQTDGKIVMSGNASGMFYDYDFALVRYNTDGSLDTEFGGNGLVTTDFGHDDDGMAIVIQPDGKLIVAGNTYDVYDFALARYNPDGNLDTTFGTGGKVTTDLLDSHDFIQDAALQPDGMLVVTGRTNLIEGSDFVVARYTAFSSGVFNYDPNGQFDYLALGETATDTFTYVVSDGVLTDTATVSITVTGVNDPPLFTSTPVTAAVSTIPYAYSVTADDLDAGDTLTFTTPTLPAWLSLIDHGDRSATLNGTPTIPGSFPVVLAASDGITSTTQAFTITVSANPVTPTADLSITQAFQWTSSGSGSGSAAITLVVSNLGPDAVPGAVVSDTFPLSFSNVTWTCAGSGGAACTPSGSGDINDMLLSLPAGGVVTYTVTVGDILPGSWSNTAQVLAPAGVSDPALGNNQASFEIYQVLLPVAFRQYPPLSP